MSKESDEGLHTASKDLEAAGAFQQLLIDGVTEPIMLVGTDYQVKLMNRAARVFSSGGDGAPESSLCYQISHRRQEPCAGTEHPCPLEKVRESGQPVTVEHQHYLANGELRIVETIASPVWGADGTVQGIIEHIHDITERKQLEAKLEERQLYLESMLSCAPDAIVTLDKQHKVLEWNQGAEKLFGYSAQEATGRDLDDLISGGDPRTFAEATALTRQSLAGQPLPSTEVLRYGKDGTALDVIVAASPILLANEPVGAVAIYTDITDRKQAEGRLRDANELLEKVFSSTHLLIAYLDADFSFIRVNRAYAEADHREPEFFAGKNHFELYPNEENEAIFRRVADTGKPASFRAKPFEYAEHPERGMTYWDWDVIPVKDSSGKVEGLVLGLVNVTERVEAEEELRKHADHLEALVTKRAADLVAANAQLQQEIAERKQAEQALQSRTLELQERVKELNCLYGVSALVEQPGILLAEIFQETVNLLPPAWQFPEISAARILVEDQEFRTENFQESRWRQGRDIMVHGKRVGTVEACYLEERPAGDEGPFLPEESDLLNAVAERLGRIIEQVQSEEALQRAHNELETRVLERTAELSEANERLRAEVAERERAEEALREERDFAQALVETAQAIVLVLDAEGRIVHLNPYMEEISGYRLQEVQGKDWFATFLPQRDQDSVRALFSKAVSDIQTRGNVNPIVTKDGREREIEWYDKTLKDAAGSVMGVLAIGQDITERQQAQEALQRMRDESEQRVSERTRELQTLYDVTALAAHTLDLQETVERSLERLVRAVPCHGGAMHLLDETGKLLRLAADRGLPLSLVAQLETLRPDRDWIGPILEDGEPVVIPDLATHPSAHRMAEASGFQMYVGAPMRARGMSVGVFHLFGEANQEWSVEDLALLTSVADHVGIAVENAWLQKRAEQAAVLEERERLARQLHESVTQSLFSLTLFAETARNLAGSGDADRIGQPIDQIETIARQVLKETRLTIYQMRPAVLEQEGLVGALRRRLDAVEGRVGAEARVLTDTLIELPPAAEEELYYIAQEALNNALRHATATSVTVHIRSEGEHLVLEVADNGCGFDPDAVRGQGGMGLTNMQKRAEKLGGTLVILSKPGQGTTIRAEASLVPQAEPARANEFQ